MEFRILGPLEVHDEGRGIALGAAKQRSLLAMLLLHRNQVVATDRLVDGLWGEQPPETANKALQVYVSQLRRVLDPERLLTRAPGYLLRVEPDELDLDRFERLVADAQGLGPEGRARTLRAALDLWRGPALADFQYEAFAQGHIARLAELRLGALEERISADLASGRHAELIGELEELVLEEPLRERPRADLMLALYRSGRQADALAAYREARRTLVEEVGLEPSPELQELEQAILRQDPALAPAAPAPAPDSGAPTATGFVGRRRELAALVDRLEAGLSGRGGLCLIAGEPGIGKSRLADELGRRARERGARVLWGRCWEAGGAPAYWPWVQALRAYVRERGPAPLRRELGAGAERIAGLLPELSTLLPDLDTHPPAEDEGARFRLFDATAQFLRAAAAAQPLVIVLDDIHVADTPSLLLLQLVAGELPSAPILVLATYRDVAPVPGERLTTILSELSRTPATLVLPLGGLSETDVGRLIELSTSTAPRGDLTAAIHAETEGNPLFVSETVRLLAAEGRLEDVRPDAIAIPRNVRHVIRRRLAQLPAECLDMLTAASVLGRDFQIDALERLTRIPREHLLELLDEAVRSRALTDGAGVRGRLRFAHALIRDTLYEELGSGPRARLHHRAGAALEELYAADLEPHLSELAHHYGAAPPEEAGAKALDYAWRAGDRAARLIAYEEAARLYQMAVEVLERQRPDDLASRCDLLLALGDVHFRAGDGPRARETLRRAADLARRIEAPERLAQAALLYGGRFVWARAAADEHLLPLLYEALAGLDDADSILKARLLGRLTTALRSDPSREERDRLALETVEMARRLGDDGTLAYALDARVCGTWSPDDMDARFDQSRELIEVAARVGDGEREFSGHENLLHTALEGGDLRTAEAALDAMAVLAEELRQPAQQWNLTLVRANRALEAGEFARAEELIGEAHAIGQRFDRWTVSVARRVQLFVLYRAQGRLDELASVHPLDEFASPLVARCVRIRLDAETGRDVDARRALAELRREDLARFHFDEEWILAISLLAEAVQVLDDVDAAAEVYDAAVPYSGLNAVVVPAATYGSIDRLLGVLAGMLGRWKESERHFETALEMNARMGARPWLAHTRHDYAAMLLGRGRPGDAERARELMEAAIAGYRELGMETWERRAGELAPALRAAT